MSSPPGGAPKEPQGRGRGNTGHFHQPRPATGSLQPHLASVRRRSQCTPCAQHHHKAHATTSECDDHLLRAAALPLLRLGAKILIQPGGIRRRRRRFSLKELQGAVTFLIASSASGGAVTIVGPIAPHTILTVVTMASAVLELFGRLVFTSLPSMLGHLLNVAITPLLATTLVASTPCAPVAPQAIDDLFPESARICATWNGLTDGFVARQSTILSLAFDPPHTSHLPSSTRGGTVAPVFPISERTGLSWFASTSWRWTFASIRIALIDLLGGTKAPLTLATSVLCDASGSTLHPITSARAITPCTPIVKFAVCIFGTRNCFIALLIFLRKPNGWFATLVCLCFDLS